MEEIFEVGNKIHSQSRTRSWLPGSVSSFWLILVPVEGQGTRILSLSSPGLTSTREGLVKGMRSSVCSLLIQ